MNPHYQKSYQNIIKVLIIYRYLWVLSEPDRRSEKGKQDRECLSPPAPHNKGGVGLQDEKKSGEKSQLVEKPRQWDAVASGRSNALRKRKSFRIKHTVSLKLASGGSNSTLPKSVKNREVERQNCTGAARILDYDSHRMGGFLQTDPTGYTDSMNLYQAFNMNGINYFDPM